MTDEQPPRVTVNGEVLAQIKAVLAQPDLSDFEKKFMTDMLNWRFPTEKQSTILNRILKKYGNQPDPVADDAF